MEIRDGTAITIADSITKLCTDLDLDMLYCFCGLGSDGASVMLGSREGISKLLRDKSPFLVSNHCIAHRLALACGQAANQIQKSLKIYLTSFIASTRNHQIEQPDLRKFRKF